MHEQHTGQVQFDPLMGWRGRCLGCPWTGPYRGNVWATASADADDHEQEHAEQGALW